MRVQGEIAKKNPQRIRRLLGLLDGRAGIAAT